MLTTIDMEKGTPSRLPRPFRRLAVRPSSLGPVAIGIAAVLALSACSDGTGPTEDPPRVTTILVAPASVSIDQLGDNVQLAATVLDQHGNPMTDSEVVWTAIDPTVATVSVEGLVTAVADGQTEVTAELGSVVGRANVTIDAPGDPGQVSYAPSVTPAMAANINSVHSVFSTTSSEAGSRLNLAPGGLVLAATAAGDPILAAVAGERGAVAIGPESTAEAMLDALAAFLEFTLEPLQEGALTGHVEFGELVELVAAEAEAGRSFLDSDGVRQLAVQIVVEVFNAQAPASRVNSFSEDFPIKLDDGPRADFGLRNTSFTVFQATSMGPEGQSALTVVPRALDLSSVGQATVSGWNGWTTITADFDPVGSTVDFTVLVVNALWQKLTGNSVPCSEAVLRAVADQLISGGAAITTSYEAFERWLYDDLMSVEGVISTWNRLLDCGPEIEDIRSPAGLLRTVAILLQWWELVETAYEGGQILSHMALYWAAEETIMVCQTDGSFGCLGAIRVFTETIGPEPLPDGYLVALDGSQGMGIIANDSEGVRFGDLTVGQHSVELEDVPSECRVEGLNPRNVSAPEGDEQGTTFRVDCTPVCLESAQITNQEDVDALQNVTCIDGNLTLLDTPLTSAEFPLLESVGGTILVQNNAALSSVGLPALTQIDTDLNVWGNASLAAVNLPLLTSLGRQISINDNPALASISAPVLTGSVLLLSVNRNAKLASITVPKIQNITNGFWITNNGAEAGALSALSFPALTSSRLVRVFENDAFNGLDLPVLGTVPEEFWVTGNRGFTYISAPNLTRIMGSMDIYFNTRLVEWDLRRLQRIDGCMFFLDNGTATSGRATLEFPALTWVECVNFGGNESWTQLKLPLLEGMNQTLDVRTNPNLTTVLLPSVTSIGDNIHLVDNPALIDVDFTSLTAFDHTWLAGNGTASLSTAPLTFPALTTIRTGGMVINDNGGFSSVSFPLLTSMATGIDLRSNQRLAGFYAAILPAAPGGISVPANPSLSVFSVPSMTSAGTLGFADNPSYCASAVDALAAQLGFAPGTYVNSGNAGCEDAER